MMPSDITDLQSPPAALNPPARPSAIRADIALQGPKADVACFMITKKVRRFLHRKKFQTLVAADIAQEIASIKRLDTGFTQLFTFLFFIVLFFLSLSLQLRPSENRDMRDSIMMAIGGDLLEVGSVDAAFDALERIYLNVFESAYFEHECFSCIAMDAVMKRRVGVKMCADLCAHSSTDSRWAVDPFQQLFPLCNEFCDPKCYDGGRCENFDPTPLVPATYMYNPVSVQTMGGVDAFLDRISDEKVCESIDYSLYGKAPLTQRFSEFIANMVEILAGDILPYVPNFSDDFIVDCGLVVHNRTECTSVDVGNGSPALDCNDVMRHLTCDGQYDGQKNVALPLLSGGEMSLNLTCPLTTVTPVDCDARVYFKRSMLSTMGCLPGMFADCKGKCFELDTLTRAFGDGKCPVDGGDIEPFLHCAQFEWDGGDCNSVKEFTGPYADCQGSYDCLGTCIPDATCATLGIPGITDCASLLSLMSLDSETCYANNIEDQVNLSCRQWKFNSGACGDLEATFNWLFSLQVAAFDDATMLSQGSCEDGKFSDCRERCFDADAYREAWGNGVCNLIDDETRPCLNCATFLWDADDCTDQKATDGNCDNGVYDCTGVCMRDSDCVQNSASCYDLLTFFSSQPDTCSRTEYDIDTSCLLWNFNSGACGPLEELYQSTHGGGRKTRRLAEMEIPFGAFPRGGWGTSFTKELQRGGFVGKHKSIGAGALLSFKVNTRLPCDKGGASRTFQSFALCDSGVQDTSPLFMSTQDMSYSKELKRHVDLVDFGHWGVGLEVMFCRIRGTRKYWKNPYHPKVLREMTIAIPVFNGDMRSYGTYGLMEIQFTFLDTGRVTTLINVEAFSLGAASATWKDNKMRMTLEAMCLFFAICMLVLRIRDLRMFGFSMKRLFSLCVMLVFLILCVVWGVIMIASSSPISAELLEGDPIGSRLCDIEGTQTPCGYPESIEQVMQIVYFASLYSFYKNFAICFCIVALIECFLILSFHKRLSILTETLYEATSDIYHWGIVIGMLTLVFSTVFYYLFGRRMAAFSTWTGSFSNLLLMIIGLFTIEGELTPLEWALVMLYGMIIAIIMINLSLGIVLDAYNFHTKEREESDTLPHSLSVYFYRHYAQILHSIKWLIKRFVKRDSRVADGAISGKQLGQKYVPRRQTGKALLEFTLDMSNLNNHQLRAMPISIAQAKDILRGEFISDAMVRDILKQIIVNKLCEGGLEKKKKQSIFRSSPDPSFVRLKNKLMKKTQ